MFVASRLWLVQTIPIRLLMRRCCVGGSKVLFFFLRSKKASLKRVKKSR